MIKLRHRLARPAAPAQTVIEAIPAPVRTHTPEVPAALPEPVTPKPRQRPASLRPAVIDLRGR